jgi:hypothetical protein
VNAIIRLLAAAALCAATAVSLAGETPCNDSCTAPGHWLDLNTIAVKVSYPGTPGYAMWRGKFDSASNDYQLDSEMSDGNATRAGTILMVGGLVMAVRGEVVKPGLELSLLDGAALSQQLVYRLLSTAIPAGPQAIAHTQKVRYASDSLPILLSTPSAEAVVSAPWSVTGTVKQLTGGTIEYDLSVHSGGGSAGGAISAYNPHLAGRLSRTASARLDDSISLAGWKTYDVASRVDAGNGASMAVAGIHTSARPYRTVAEVRKELNAEDGAEAADVRDFTGLWKEHCEDAFGLQILHNNEGRDYLIVFCTPGGCEEPGSGRRSFIAGDVNYEIVGDNEIIQTGEQGGRQRYLRCAAADN